ncbi:TorA maturation chaperone TorD [Desulfobaculum xiamenense]|uniref:TorA maturation chaperone TorD n=1 Tax=Desulfobaculum xiamenense TaxID=995050 RepID=A0A846QKA6_9BACT|nr:molecular chaperone TorD family protein [Desulfobaculum xiamenense]NJB67567.1 TorA maturation chaperone TorD [Desulfobaculum xiamenense]
MTTPSTEALTGCALALAFLGRSLYFEPDHDFPAGLDNGLLFRDWPLPATDPDTREGLALIAAFFDAHGTDAAPLVRTDFTQLFLGPVAPLAAWESVWTSSEGLLFDESTQAVREAYAHYGLETPDTRREPDDHIGLELAFLAHALLLAASAQADGNARDAMEHIDAARIFLAKHPARWAASFLHRMAQRAATDYYRGIARLCIGTLNHVSDLLDADWHHA